MTFPALSLALAGQNNLTFSTPAPGGSPAMDPSSLSDLFEPISDDAAEEDFRLSHTRIAMLATTGGLMQHIKEIPTSSSHPPYYVLRIFLRESSSG